MGPLVSEDIGIMNAFLQRLSDGSSDSFVNICNLADSHTRIVKAESRDSTIISSFIRKEHLRAERGKGMVEEKQRSLDILNKTIDTEKGIVAIGTGKLSTELMSRKVMKVIIY